MLGTRVDRVFQPNRDELILAFRGFSAAYKLLISARANSARVNLTTIPVENPQQPPMLCMLLRKKLQGAKLLEITQPDLERALMLKFDSVNELGDHVELTLAVEIMGRYSNIILVDENGKIIDALKRVDAEMSSERLVLPGLLYRLPPPQDKLSMLTCTVEEIMARIDALPRDMELSKALMSALQGISPIIAREVENSAGLGHEVYVKSMTPPQRRRTEMYVTTLMETAKNVSGTPHIVIDPRNKPKDFAFMDIRQYGNAMTVSEKKSFSEMLDAFYAERDQIERMRVKSQDLLRLLANHADRLSRKIANQQAELSACAERDTLRIKGDLLSANMYAIQKGETSVKLQNFYDENLAELEIALDPALTRPGRFDRRVPVELPDLAGREAILRVHAKKIKVAPDVDLAKIARMASGASGAELANIVNEAALRAVRDGRASATQADLEESIEVVIAGYQKKNSILTTREKLIVSYHEIGHALVAAKQTNSAPVQKITIIPRTSGALGYTMQVEDGNHYLMSREEIENKIATFTGGRAAEEVVFHSVTTGASNDIEQATKLARAMITRYGMSDNFDMVALETVTNQYLGGDASLACSAETQAEIDRQVVDLVKKQHAKAVRILQENRPKLDELAKFLYEKETITGEEFMDILNQ